jgi:hypothetical protein
MIFLFLFKLFTLARVDIFLSKLVYIEKINKFYVFLILFIRLPQWQSYT